MDECVRSWWWQPYLERQDSTALRAHWLDLARLVGGKKIGAPRMERRVVSRLATKRIDLHLLPPRIQVNQGRFVPIRRSTSGRMLCGSCSSVVPEASAPITAVARRDDVIN